MRARHGDDEPSRGRCVRATCSCAIAPSKRVKRFIANDHTFYVLCNRVRTSIAGQDATVQLGLAGPSSAHLRETLTPFAAPAGRHNSCATCGPVSLRHHRATASGSNDEDSSARAVSAAPSLLIALSSGGVLDASDL